MYDVEEVPTHILPIWILKLVPNDRDPDTWTLVPTLSIAPLNTLELQNGPQETQPEGCYGLRQLVDPTEAAERGSRGGKEEGGLAPSPASACVIEHVLSRVL